MGPEVEPSRSFDTPDVEHENARCKPPYYTEVRDRLNPLKDRRHRDSEVSRTATLRAGTFYLVVLLPALDALVGHIVKMEPPRVQAPGPGIIVPPLTITGSLSLVPWQVSTGQNSKVGFVPSLPHFNQTGGSGSTTNGTQPRTISTG